MQPKVETMMAAAMIRAPIGPNMLLAAAAATRSLPACWMASKVSTFRYVMLQAMYSALTTATPRANDRGNLRFGLRTSAAVNVTLFHASELNRAPTMEIGRAH